MAITTTSTKVKVVRVCFICDWNRQIVLSKIVFDQKKISMAGFLQDVSGFETQ